MMQGGYVYNYEDGVSYPARHDPYTDPGPPLPRPYRGPPLPRPYRGAPLPRAARPDHRHLPRPDNRLYGRTITSLSRETEYNLEKLKRRMLKVDPCYEFGMEHWHSSDRVQKEEPANWNWNDLPEHARPAWETTGNMFTSQQAMNKIDFRNIDYDHDNRETKENGPVPTCYLCTTLEEHERHLAKRGPQLKEKQKPKPRKKYIAPPPFVKPKPEEIEEKKECLYKVTVKTGTLYKSGTSANVSITLAGQRGVMQKKELTKKRTNFTFGVGTSEVFYIKGPNLADLKYLIVEHDGLEQKHAWFLEYIEVHNMTSDKCWVFSCKNWLSLYDGDSKVKRKLRAQIKETIETEKDIRRTTAEFEIKVYTADKKMAGTDANVFITLYGKKGFSPKHKLESKGKKDPFESGSEDKFHLITKDLGSLTSVKLEHDNSGFGPGWLVEKVVIHDLGYDKVYTFPVGQWLATDEGDGAISRVLYPLTDKAKKQIRTADFGKKSNRKGRFAFDDEDEEAFDHQATVNYEVAVKTGHTNYAGTDAKVYVQLFGKKERTREEYLPDADGEKFEKGKTDTFKFRATNVGNIKKIKLRHDNSGLGAGWFVEQVAVRRFYTKDEVNKKMDDAEDELDRHVKRRVSMMTGEDPDDLEEELGHRKSSARSRLRRDRLSTVDEDEDEEKEGHRRNRRHRHADDDSDDDEDSEKIQRKKKRNKKYTNHSESEDSDEEAFKSRRGKRVGRRRIQKHYMIGNKEFVLTETESDSDDDYSRRQEKSQKKGRKVRHSESEESEDENLRRKKNKSRRNRAKYDESEESESEDESFRKRSRRQRKGRDSEDEDSDSFRRKRGKNNRKQRERFDSEDESDDDLPNRKKNRRKRGDSSESESSSDSDEDSNSKKNRRRKSKYHQDSDDSNTNRKRSSKRNKHHQAELERRGLTTVFAKDRVPYYDEYIFECNKWFAEDEGDGSIERTLKPNSCTTFYKIK